MPGPRRNWIVAAFAVVGVVAIASILWIWQRKNEGEHDRIKVGVVLPLTGEGAPYGASARRAIELAFAQTNAKGGVNGRFVEAVFEDSQGLPEKGISAFRKLVNLDKVPAVVGDLFSAVTIAIAPIAERNKVVVLSPTSSAPKLTTAGDYIFRNCASDNFEGAIMGATAPVKLKHKRIAVLYINNEYGVGILDVFEKNLKRNGGEVVLKEAFPQGATDLRTQLTKIAATGPDAIYLIGYKELGQALKQAGELGFRGHFLSTVMFEDPQILAIAGPAAEGVIYSARPYDPASTDPVVQAFVEDYRTRFGEVPDIFAAYSFDAANILVRAISDGGSKSDEIKSAMYRIRGFRGVFGNVQFDENGDVDQIALLKTVRNGKFVRFEN